MHAVRRPVLASMLLIVIASTALAQDCVEYSQYMRWIEAFDYRVAPSDFETVGNRLYVLDPHYDVRVLRLVDGRPESVLGTIPSGGSTYGMDVVGEVLFLAQEYRGLVMWNVEGLYSPREIATVPLDAVFSVVVVDGLAYLGGLHGLYVVDVLDPYHPQLVGFADLGHLQGIAVNGSVVYALGPGRQMNIVDCSVPYSPVVVGQQTTPVSVRGIVVEDGLLYVLDYNTGLDVYDVTQPLSPAYLTHVAIPAYCVDLDVQGGIACVAKQGTGVAVVDVSDPSDMALVGHIETRGSVDAVGFTGRYAVAGMDWDGIDVLDVAPLAAAPVLGQLTLSTRPGAASVQDDLAYVVSDTRMTIVDTREAEALAVVGTVAVPGSARAVAVDGHLAWLAAWNGGLQVVDVGDPAHPVHLGGLAFAEPAWDVVAMDDEHVVVGTSAGFCTVDGHDPAQPTLVASRDLPDAASGLALDDDTLFVANGEAGLAIFDLADPVYPVSLAELDFPGCVIRDVEVVTGYAIVADGWGSVFVVDVMDPTSPVVLGSVLVPGSPQHVAVRGHVAAISGDGTTLIDFQNPGQPEVLGGYSFADVAASADDFLLGLHNASDRNRLYALPRQCGDDPVATQVWGFTAVADAAAVRLAWFHLLGGDVDCRVRGSRADDASANWLVPAIQVGPDGGTASDATPAARQPGTICYRLECRSAGPAWQTVAETTVDVPVRSGLPFLAPARPNPFNPRTTVSFTLPGDDHVTLAVHDAQGRRVTTLATGAFAAGEHVRTWDGRDAAGGALPSGTYFARLTTSAGVRTTKMVLVR